VLKKSLNFYINWDGCTNPKQNQQNSHALKFGHIFTILAQIELQAH
jgi:hypothetical protein